MQQADEDLRNSLQNHARLRKDYERVVAEAGDLKVVHFCCLVVHLIIITSSIVHPFLSSFTSSTTNELLLLKQEISRLLIEPQLVQTHC